MTEPTVKKVDSIKQAIDAASETKDEKAPEGSKYFVPDIILKEDLSEHCVSVLEEFGVEAPSILNDYSCKIEDAFLQAVEDRKILSEAVTKMNAEINDLRQFKRDILVQLGLPSPYPELEEEDEQVLEPDLDSQ